jgi:transcriptional repressor NrdR
MHCQARFTTFEVAELDTPRIIKQDKSIETYNSSKLRRGLELALEKRPVDPGSVEKIIDNIEYRLRREPDREIPARRLGEWIMAELKELDEVAYIRFASVYLSFQDVEAFKHIIDRLASRE